LEYKTAFSSKPGRKLSFGCEQAESLLQQQG
jgi:hypothetical protein